MPKWRARRPKSASQPKKSPQTLESKFLSLFSSRGGTGCTLHSQPRSWRQGRCRCRSHEPTTLSSPAAPQGVDERRARRRLRAGTTSTRRPRADSGRGTARTGGGKGGEGRGGGVEAQGTRDSGESECGRWIWRAGGGTNCLVE